MDWTEYEEYVACFVKELESFKKATISTNRRFAGVRQPGEYEVDIAVEMDLEGVLRFLLVVECKNWKRPVDRPVIQKLIQTRDAICAQKAAVVSPVGFTKEATEVAVVHGVALWVLAEGEWHTISGAVGPHESVMEFGTLRLDLLAALDVEAKEPGNPVAIRLEELPSRTESGGFHYTCYRGSAVGLNASTIGVDPRTAVAEIVNQIYSAAFVTDPMPTTVVPSLDTWLRQTSRRFRDHGFSEEQICRLVEAIGRCDLHDFEIIRLFPQPRPGYQRIGIKGPLYLRDEGSQTRMASLMQELGFQRFDWAGCHEGEWMFDVAASEFSSAVNDLVKSGSTRLILRGQPTNGSDD